MLNKLKEDVKKLANSKKAKVYHRFFKTGKGEYGYGDKFLGLTVPESRKIAIKYKDLPFSDIKILLKSKIHEKRLIALLILVHRFSEGDKKEDLPSLKLRRARKEIYDFYLRHTKYINNWDLVDLSAYKIVGQYLLEVASRHSGERGTSDSRISFVQGVERFWTSQNDILIRLAKSKNLWERRISIIATYQFIKNGRYQETLIISEMLLKDKHDLIHKAVGWMLREVGKNCSQEILEKFLKEHYKQMPRTMLRYAIERFPDSLRKVYLEGKI